MVAITQNSDLGDSWEWADSPEYPERYSALGIRIGVNYVVYAILTEYSARSTQAVQAGRPGLKMN